MAQSPSASWIRLITFLFPLISFSSAPEWIKWDEINKRIIAFIRIHRDGSQSNISRACCTVHTFYFLHLLWAASRSLFDPSPQHNVWDLHFSFSTRLLPAQQFLFFFTLNLSQSVLHSAPSPSQSFLWKLFSSNRSWTWIKHIMKDIVYVLLESSLLCLCE